LVLRLWHKAWWAFVTVEEFKVLGVFILEKSQKDRDCCFPIKQASLWGRIIRHFSILRLVVRMTG
jgi:hypothetical protein